MEAMVLSEICGNVEQLLATLISRYPKLNIDRIGTMFDVNDARRQIVLEHSLCDERIGEHLQIHTDVIGTETTEHIQREEVHGISAIWEKGRYAGMPAKTGRGLSGRTGRLEHIPEMTLERGKGRLSYNELELSYEIHQIPQNGEGAVEKLLY